jgi:hypothetical protein
MDKKQIIEDYLQGRHPMEQQSWELPSVQELDNAEAEFDRLMEARNKPRRRLRLWPLAAAACVAGIIAIFLAPPRTTEEQPPLALEETTVNIQQSTYNSQLNTLPKGRLGSLELPLNVATAPQREANPHSRRRERMEGASQLSTVNSQEPMLAEAEINASHLGEVGRGALPEMEDPFLAIAEQMQDIRSRGEQVRQVVAQLIDNQVNIQ